MNAAQLAQIKTAKRDIRQAAITLRRVAGGLPDKGFESAWKTEIQEWIRDAEAMLNHKPGGLAVAIPKMKITSAIKPVTRPKAVATMEGK